MLLQKMEPVCAACKKVIKDFADQNDVLNNLRKILAIFVIHTSTKGRLICLPTLATSLLPKPYSFHSVDFAALMTSLGTRSFLQRLNDFSFLNAPP